MKVTFIFLAVFFVTLAKELQSEISNEDDDAFEIFKNKYKVTYKNKKEEIKRKFQYRKCRAMIQEHNEKYVNRNVRLVMSVTGVGHR